MGSENMLGWTFTKTRSIAVMNSAGKLIMESIIDAVRADQGWNAVP
jgi:hypothetical protein